MNWTQFSSQEIKKPLSVKYTLGGFYMAKKGQKFKKYSSELREEILKKYWNGEKYWTKKKRIKNPLFFNIL